MLVELLNGEVSLKTNLNEDGTVGVTRLLNSVGDIFSAKVSPSTNDYFISVYIENNDVITTLYKIVNITSSNILLSKIIFTDLITDIAIDKQLALAKIHSITEEAKFLYRLNNKGK